MKPAQKINMRMGFIAPFLFMFGTVFSNSASAQACLSAHEMREAISENHVIQPAVASKSARAAAPGDVVRIRLCRDEETLIYLVTTLKRDGRVQRVTVEAVSGKVTVVR